MTTPADLRAAAAGINGTGPMVHDERVAALLEWAEGEIERLREAQAKDLSPALDEAFLSGAEAMREKAAQIIPEYVWKGKDEARWTISEAQAVEDAAEDLVTAIRALPAPKREG